MVRRRWGRPVSERGVFAVDRGIWDHDVLVSADPFSRREAWLWLLSEAAWKPHKRRIAGKTIEVQRGQVAASLRFMASKWRWTEARVRRFLASLISSEMVDAKTDAGLTVVTICNYDAYQRVSLPSDATREIDVDAAATQQRRKVEDKEDKETDSEASASGATAPIAETPEARLWRVGLTDLVALGLSEPRARSMIGSWRRDTGDDCQGVLGAIMRAREYAVTNPIPWITAALKPRKTDEKSKSVHAAAADLVADIRKLNERPGGVRSGEGAAPVRLLSQG